MIAYTFRNGVVIAAHATGDVDRTRSYGSKPTPRVAIKRKQSAARRALAALFA